MGRRLDANTEVIQETIQEVAKLQDGTSFIKDDVKAVFDAFENLASKVCRIEGNQDITLRGVGALHAQCQENQRIQESNKALPSTSSLPALEAAPMAPSSKVNDFSLLSGVIENFNCSSCYRDHYRSCSVLLLTCSGVLM
jgi:prophage DNA circulation protein